MDRDRFDILTRLVAASRSRRAALGTLLGAALLGLPLPPVAAKRKATRKGKGKPKRRGRDRDRRQPRPQRRRPAQTEAAGRCCSRNACVPGPGANLGKCCFEDAELAGENIQGANLGQANFARANLTGVNFRGANLDRTCLVDADVTGARFGGANTGTAIYCRTRTDAGEDNSGCHRGTVCCPTCDEAHPCADDEVCCDGRCVTGDCCDNGEQSTCNAEEICCEHRCAAGECCAAR